MRPIFACAALLAFAGCPESKDPPFIDAPDPDAPLPIDGPPIPSGPENTFVGSALDLPENAAEAMMLGLDIDERPNDGVDNQLGQILGSLGALAPDLDIQAATDQSVATGTTILLVSMQADSLVAGPAGVRTFEGTDPLPAPCASPQDQVCSRHLTGTGSFNVGPTHSTAPIVGVIDGGRFTGAMGEVVLPLAFAGGPPAWMPLIRAKADLQQVSATGFRGKIGGAVTLEDVNNQLIPQMAISIRASFDATCDVGGTPPDCGCVPGEDGETLRGLFDKPPTQDCMISDPEVQAVISGFLTPDIDINGDGQNDSMSIGVGVIAVPGGFTPP